MTRGTVATYNPSKVRTVNWHKLEQATIEQRYTIPLEQAIKDHMETSTHYSTWTAEQVDEELEFLVQLVKTQANKLPITKHNKRTKTYWNSTLSQLSRDKKVAWRNWVANGRPKEDNNPYRVAVKRTKQAFRLEQRRAKTEEIHIFHRKLENQSTEVDQKQFWQLVNKRRSTKCKGLMTPLHRPDGSLATDPEDILEEWRLYFQKLYTPELKDTPHDKHVKTTIHTIDANDTTMNDPLQEPIYQEEVKNACRKLKNAKAPGYDGEQGEHPKYGGDCMHAFLANIFNAMARLEHRPETLKKGVIVPIPKGTKDLSKQPQKTAVA